MTGKATEKSFDEPYGLHSSPHFWLVTQKLRSRPCFCINAAFNTKKIYYTQFRELLATSFGGKGGNTRKAGPPLTSCALVAPLPVLATLTAEGQLAESGAPHSLHFGPHPLLELHGTHWMVPWGAAAIRMRVTLPFSCKQARQ